MGTTHFLGGIFAAVALLSLSFEVPALAADPATPAAATAAPATPAPPPENSGLAALNLIRPRANASPNIFNFKQDGSLEKGGDSWIDKKFSLDRKHIHFNGPTAGSSRDYVELTTGAGGRLSRAIIFGARDVFSEFNVASIADDKVTTATRCTSEVAPTERQGGELTCWTLNKPACAAIMKEAKVDNPEKLLGKLRECMDLKTAIRKLPQELVGDLKKQQDIDVEAMRMAKDFSPRFNYVKFKFDDPTNMKLQYQWVKYLAIASSCSAIMADSVREHRTIEDVVKAVDYKAPDAEFRNQRPVTPPAAGVRGG